MHLIQCAGGKHTTFETNNLIQSNRSVFLLMQNYPQAFFPTEISNVIFAAIFAGGHSTLTFEMYKMKRDKFYQKCLRDEFLFKRITIICLTRENPKMYEKRLSQLPYIMFTGSFDIKQSYFIWICNPSA